MTTSTNETFGASFTPIDIDGIRLHVRSSSSYGCNDVYSLAAFLASRRYTELDPRSSLEFRRYRKDERLIVMYQSGSVVLQGNDVDGARRELSRFVVAPEPMVIDFDPQRLFDAAKALDESGMWTTEGK